MQEQLLETILSKGNLTLAFERVMANKGAGGVDGIEGEAFSIQIKSIWKATANQLQTGTYRPSAVRRVSIPKDHGTRNLGLPTYLDKMIQQAISQVLSPMYEPEFSEYSYGFRPAKNAHQALKQAQQYINEGYDHVVDLDLEKFFDRVNHDYLMNELSKKIKDKRVLKLIHSILRADIQEQGILIPCREGVPQGGNLSPLLSNIVLDKLDKELTRRGHRFIRYADDCSIYVKSKRSGDRVMESITRYIEKELKLKVNTVKSTVTRPWRTKLLGFTFYPAKGRRIITVHRKSREKYKDKIRAITSRSKPYSMEYRMNQIRMLNQGWGNYFKLSEAKSVFEELDGWVRSRIRLCYWKQWKLPRTRIARLKELGIQTYQAYQWGNTRKGYWRTVHSPILLRSLNNAFLKKAGFVSLKDITKPAKLVYV